MQRKIAILFFIVGTFKFFERNFAWAMHIFQWVTQNKKAKNEQ